MTQVSKQPARKRQILLSPKLERFLKKKLSVAVSIIDEDMELIWCNDMFRTWFGPINKFRSGCYKIHHGAESPPKGCPAVKTFLHGKVEYYIKKAFTRDGEIKDYRFTTVPIWDRYGAVAHVLEIVEPVNCSRTVEEAISSQYAEMGSAGNGTNLAIFCLDRYGTITSTNPEHLRLAQASKEKVIGLNWLDVPKSMELGLTQYLNRGLQGEPFELFNFRYSTYRGDKEIYMNIKGIPLNKTDGSLAGLLCIAEDVTAKIKILSSDNVIIGNSAKIKQVIEVIKRIAPYPYPVIIEGESGTGKELVAQEIHNNSTRTGKPFVAINAAAFQDNLLESELFGYAKGAFTGAEHEKRGLFEIANNSTFFIDEIGEMSLAMQSKLLRILETGSFRRLGDTKEIRVNIRIIAATNRNLENEVMQRKFRKDLYYRLNVFKISLPPLRDRLEDIPLLANYFLNRENMLTDNKKYFTPLALLGLQKYDWPGNVRELANIVKSLLVLSEKESIDIIDMPLPIPKDIPTGSVLKEKTLAEVVAKAEENYIIETLNKYEGNKIKVAEILGISVRSLYRKILNYNIELE